MSEEAAKLLREAEAAWAKAIEAIMAERERAAHLHGLMEARDLAWSMYSSAATLMPRVAVTLPIIEAIDSRVQQLQSEEKKNENNPQS